MSTTRTHVARAHSKPAPSNSGRFHGNRRNLGLGQPLRQLWQLLRHGPKDALLLTAGSVFILADQTGGDGLLVWVQATTIAMHSHGESSSATSEDACTGKSPCELSGWRYHFAVLTASISTC